MAGLGHPNASVVMTTAIWGGVNCHFQVYWMTNFAQLCSRGILLILRYILTDSKPTI